MPQPWTSRNKNRILRYTSDYEASEPRTRPSLRLDHDPRRTAASDKSQRIGRYNAGSLKVLTKMPLDMLYEIFGHLHPRDILHLARTSRGLRAVLMNRSSLSVWKSAFSSVPDLPFCPLDLTLPQYANLAFDEHCNFCLVGGMHDIYWSCRVRCCKKCRMKYFVPESVLVERLSDAVIIHRLENIFPYAINPRPRPSRPSRLLYYLPVAESYIRELDEIINTEPEAMLIKWGQEKRAQQRRRLIHAALCESRSIDWVYHPSGESNVVIVVFLIVLLVFIWRHKIW